MSLNSDEFEPLVGNDGENQKRRRRGESLPAMAFADELFLNGRVMPLKLPPRLQSFSKSSQVSLPRSPRTASKKKPFARSSWNDDFDPFTVALDKVREDGRGDNSRHRRSRSHSLFMPMPKKYTNDCYTEHVAKANSSDKTTRASTPTNRLRGFFSRKRVGSTKIQDSPDKAVSPTEQHTKSNSEVSRVQNLKRFLLQYASFRREDKSTRQMHAQKHERRVTSA